MNITNWKKALASAVLDPAVGIRIAPLTTSQEFCMFVTEILPGKKVGAHYHQEGTEVYEILQGEGTLHIGTPTANTCNDIKSISVQAGDFFNIDAGMAHQLENTGHQPLILVFGCPPTHLNTDRILVEDLVS